MSQNRLATHIGRRISLPGHFDVPVILEDARLPGSDGSGGDGREPKVATTKRYDLVSRLTSRADHVLVLTATPHHGDEDRFAHFLRLIDPDLFPEPHRLGKQAAAIRRDVFRPGKDSPWALRRLKKQQDLLEEPEGLTPAQRARRLAALQGRLPDAEQEDDDLDDAVRDPLLDECTAALELEQLRAEIVALKDLVEQPRRVREQGGTGCQPLFEIVPRDIRPQQIVDASTGDVHVKRIEAKGRQRGQPVRLTTNEWYKAYQLAETCWLHVVREPLGKNPELPRIHDPALRLDHAKREILAARFFEIPAEAVMPWADHSEDCR